MGKFFNFDYTTIFINEKLIKRKTNRPKIVLFIDDMNAPVPENYGAQPAIEVLRNLVDHKQIFETCITKF